MSIKPPPLQENITGISGRAIQTWALWFETLYRALNGSAPLKLSSYTVSTLPSAANYEANITYVSNETGGATIAFSDGTNWRRVQDRAIVS